MAHEITIREGGKAEMAYTGSKTAIWHGLGQELPENQSIEQWKKAAGMDWEAHASSVAYSAYGEEQFFPNKKALFRSDTKAPLSIVGAEYKVVQPGEVLEFFDDLTKSHGMKLSTAGTLFGGTRFWALAETKNRGEVAPGDEIGGYLLLTTSVDGTLSTQARFTSTRVVCNNTLTVALSSHSKKNVIRITHKTNFDPKQVKLDMGLIDSSWTAFMDNISALKNLKMDETTTRNFYTKLFYDPSKKEEEQSLGNIRTVERLMVRAFNGVGSEMSKGTAWGALNGATELFTHGDGKNTDQSRRFWDTYAGTQSDIKMDVYSKLMEMVAV